MSPGTIRKVVCLPLQFCGRSDRQFNLTSSRKITISDPSLSDEPQGVRYSLRDKIEIAQKFDEAGIGEIFHHIHGVTDEKLECIKALCGLGLRAKVTAALRAPSEPRWKEYMDRLIEGGISEIQLYENTRARLDFAVPGKQDVLSTEQMVEKFIEGVEYAKKGGVLVSVAVGPRLWPNFSDFDFLMRIYNECIKAGAEKFWVYLSSPISPHGVEALVNRINKAIVKKVPFGIHIHNDYGLGVAGQIAAVLSGATHVEAYTNGMSDRSGPPMEELAVALEMFYGIKTASSSKSFTSSANSYRKKVPFRFPRRRAYRAPIPSSSTKTIHRRLSQQGDFQTAGLFVGGLPTKRGRPGRLQVDLG